MERIWSSLYENAKKNLVSKEISDFITTGNTSCALLGHNKAHEVLPVVIKSEIS